MVYFSKNRIFISTGIDVGICVGTGFGTGVDSDELLFLFLPLLLVLHLFCLLKFLFLQSFIGVRGFLILGLNLHFGMTRDT